MSRRSAVILVFLFLSLVNCHKNIRPDEEISPVKPDQQIFVIVERVISGPVFNTDLVEPFGLAESRDGSIYVVDRGTNRIIKFNSDFEPESQFGGFGQNTETFNRPSFVTVDNDLNIYVTDENNRRVARIDARLNFVDEISFKDDEDPFKFGYPSGVGVTSYGEVWVADREKNKLCLFNNIGKFDRFLGEFGSTEGQLQSPEKIVTTEDNRFYVCDAGHNRIVVYDQFGNFVQKLVLSEIDYLIAAAVEKNDIWVLAGKLSTIHLINKGGKELKEFGPVLPGDQTPMKEPSDLIILRNGRLLISDSGNHRLLLCKVDRGD